MRRKPAVAPFRIEIAGSVASANPGESRQSTAMPARRPQHGFDFFGYVPGPLHTTILNEIAQAHKAEQFSHEQTWL